MPFGRKKEVEPEQPFNFFAEDFATLDLDWKTIESRVEEQRRERDGIVDIIFDPCPANNRSAGRRIQRMYERYAVSRGYATRVRITWEHETTCSHVGVDAYERGVK